MTKAIKVNADLASTADRSRDNFTAETDRMV